MKKLFLASVVLTALIAQSARAADLAPAYKTRPAAPLQDWSGIYVGLEAGYGWGKQNTDAISPGDPFSPAFTPVVPGVAFVVPQLSPPLFFPDVAVSSTKQNGGSFGGFFGAQKQWGGLVLGIEGDVDITNMKGSGSANASSVSAITAASFFLNGINVIQTVNCTAGGAAAPCFMLNHNVSIDSKIDALASVRGKVGWSIAPDWLIYGTGGAAFAHVQNTINVTESSASAPSLVGRTFQCGGLTGCIFSDVALLQSASGGTTMLGWALGGGVDWKLQLDPGSALVFGIEYLHYGFPEHTITLSNNAGSTFAFRVKEEVDTVKARFSYLFSTH